MTTDPFAARGRSYEEAYFRTKDADLVAKLRSVFQSDVDKESIRKATGITNEQVLDRLVKASVRGELLTAFKLYPLIEIAWADGAFDKREAEAVVSAAVKLGVPPEGEAIRRLREWLERGPTEDGRTVWKMYAAELCKTLSEKELATFREDLLKYAKSVAEASGGVLGIFMQVSPAEQRVIDGVAKALTRH